MKVRLKWLKAMYISTIVGAGGFGWGMVFMPEFMQSLFNWPSQDPIVFGIAGSVFLAFGLLSIPGLRSPVLFSPILLLQLIYKCLWFIGVIFPLLVSGSLPPHALLYMVIFAAFIVGDLIAIPFSGLLLRSEDDARHRVVIR